MEILKSFAGLTLIYNQQTHFIFKKLFLFVCFGKAGLDLMILLLQLPNAGITDVHHYI